MPNMFSRRRGSSAHRPPPDAATMNAATAAAAASFLPKSSSNASLSSAAAAAALRSQTTSPEPVGNLVTKRMARRGSQSSVGSGSVIGSGARGGVGRGGLSRQNSAGSMTERTFRSPSPSERVSGARSPPPDVPPVPALPKNVSPQHKRSASVEPPPVQRVTSPTPRGKGARGVSVDRASMPPPRTSREAKRLSNVFEAPDEKEASDGAETANSKRTNFSRPMSPSDKSPSVAKQYTHGTGSWHSKPAGSHGAAKARPATSDGLPAQRAAAGSAQQDVPSAAGKSLKKKKSTPAAEESRLAQATRDTSYPGNEGTSYEAPDSIMVFDPATRTFKAKPREKPKQPEPPSPKPAQGSSGGLAPGTYDPATRKIVPAKPQPARSPSPRNSASSGSVQMKKQRPSLSPVDTELEPPPKNPARYSPNSSPSSSSPRASGMLHKQPSIVREDPEGEEEEGGPRASQSLRVQSLQSNGVLQTSAGPAKKYAASNSPHKRSSSLDVPRQLIEDGGRGRNVSISPPRSAHFSPSPIMEGTRHHPPGRSVSPIKSAMKQSHSPSSSVRNASPMVVRGPASDVSDTTSVTSQEGGLLPKKKKSVRVSFDDRAEEIDAAGAASPSKANVKERSPAVDDEMEDLMQPRPALPSFGSVRRTSGRSEREMPEKVTEMAPEGHDASSDHAMGGFIAANPPEKTNGNAPLPPDVISKDPVEYASDQSEEFKPETASTPAKALDTGGVEEATRAERSTTHFATETAQKLAPADDVPDISLQPPTPGEENERREEAGEKPRTSYEFDVPGRWAESDDKNVDTSSEQPQDNASVLPSRDADIVSEPSEDVYASSPVAHNDLDIIDEDSDDSDDSAAFSDAAEDLSEFEDGGFVSLNAILESPAVTSSAEKSKAAAAPPSPESPLANKAEQDQEPIKDWSATTAYWSRLSKEKRAQIEREHLSSDDEARPPPLAVPAAKKPKKRVSKQSSIDAANDEEEVRPKSSTTVGSTTSMPKTMRAKPEPSPVVSSGPAPTERVSMRRSMRDSTGSGVGMAGTSLRSGPPPQRPQSSHQERPMSTSAARPTSPIGPSMSAAGDAMRKRANSEDMPRAQDSSSPKMQSKRMSQQSPQGPPPAYSARASKPPPPNDDSDSESSFKKKRRTSQSTVDGSGRYTMRRSMRAGSFDENPVDQRPASPTPKGRGSAFGFRSKSPSGSVFSDPGRGPKLRESLRSGSVGPAPAEPKRMTLRGGPPAGRTGRSSSARPASSSGGGRSAFKSRFNRDSDDEDEPKRSFFKSRFVDSDDDEPTSPRPRHMPADLTPVRGIPKKKGRYDGDSTDLSGEEQDPRKASRKREKQSKPAVPNPAEVDQAMAAARRNLGMAQTNGNHDANQGTALSKGSLRSPAVDEPPQSPQASDANFTPDKKRRGFVGSILRRNRNSQMSVQQVPADPAASYQPASPQVSNPPASPAGKTLRRSSQQPSVRRHESYNSNYTAPTSGGDLEHEWPLPNGNRPATSDGPSAEAVRLARTMRQPDLRTRSGRVGFAAGIKEDDGEQQNAIYSNRTGKKKRFPFLRRAFGLND